MIVVAPAIRAPWIALKPSGPQPTTATLDAGSICISACAVVAPRPATATQLHAMPTSAAGSFVKIGTTHSSNVTMSSAKPPMWEFW